MECRVNKPYPLVRVRRINPFYGKLLLQNYAGEISEDTAVHLYFYESLVTKDINEFSNIMLDISKVEMHHLNLLGQVIKMLGIKPVFGFVTKKDFTFWTGLNVKYSTDLKEMLLINITSEKKAIKNYEKVIEIVDDKYIKELLSRIIEDEKLHIKIFKDLYQKYFG